MLPPADPMGTRPLRGVEPVTPLQSVSDPQREVFNRLSQIALGKMFQAEVLTCFDDGTHLVKIDQATFKALLPGDPQIGEALVLKFVASAPQPTFLLMPRNGADTTSLSAAAKLIGNVLQATAQNAESAVLNAKLPILPSASADPARIAVALQNSLGMSGAFYESHLRQWAGGARSLADILQEAHARPAMPGTQNAMPARAEAGLPSQPITVLSDWHGTHSAAQSSGAAAMPVPDGMNSESLQMLNVQLQALEHGKIAWHGELWPGQPFEWEVGEERSQEHPDNDDASIWSSTVRFSLPTLGMVSAQIWLSNNRVQMQLRAATEETASLLQEHGTVLANALDAAGSPLETFTVKQDEQA